MTNHALDSFLGDLHSAGITKLARLGRGSKEVWIKQYQISELAHTMKLTQVERSEIRYARLQQEGSLGFTSDLGPYTNLITGRPE